MVVIFSNYTQPKCRHREGRVCFFPGKGDGRKRRQESWVSNQKWTGKKVKAGGVMSVEKQSYKWFQVR